MKQRPRLGVTIATATVCALGLLGVAACSASPSAQAAQASLGTMTPEATALTALGFADTDVTGGTAADASGQAAVTTTGTAAPSASAAPDKGKRRHPGLRRLLIRRATIAKHVEHGSVTVENKNGDVTIDVQRGTITALNSTSMTVKSADGFTLTWTFGDKMRVLENRSTIQPSDVKAGETVGVAGEKDGSTETARLVVIPRQRSK